MSRPSRRWLHAAFLGGFALGSTLRRRRANLRIAWAFLAGFALAMLCLDAGELWDVRRARETAESARWDADEIAAELRQCRLGIAMADVIARSWWAIEPMQRVLSTTERRKHAKKEMTWRKN